MAKTRPYLFYDTAVSVCASCLQRVEAKVVFEDGAVFLDKWCPQHGRERVLVADDVEYYRRCREVYLKPPEMPLVFQTPTRWGCPYDCGLCPDHMQHSCLGLIEITDHCNLRCPICYSDSGPHRPGSLPLATVESMLDALVRSEGEPDVVQISGGEPTLHPELFAILDAARRRPIRHLMLNTNGIRIAQEDGFAERLAAYQPGFELYLQWDSPRDEVHERLRGARLGDVRRRALERLNAVDLSTTLVVTLERGLNDGEIGDILRFAAAQPCVRGVTFQPIQHAGRSEGYDPARHRLTISEVRRRILEQFPVFAPDDVVPVPCNPDCLAMAYALKVPAADGCDTGLVPLTRYVSAAELVEGRASIVVERDPGLRDRIFRLFSTSHSPESQAGSLRDLLCCLPRVAAPDLSYRDVFRVLIMQFFDAHSFDLRGVKKSCVHMVQPSGEIVPFDTFNLFYRDDRRQRLDALRRAARPDLASGAAAPAATESR